MIQPGEIARLAHRLGLGDKTIEKDYVLTWTLLAIAESPLRNRLAFKGGTALKKVYVPDYRFSEDLDFTLLDDISNDGLTAALEPLFAWLRREVNITLAVRRVEIHQTGNPAIYLNYVGPLGGDLSSRFSRPISRVMRCSCSHSLKPRCMCHTAIAGRVTRRYTFTRPKRSWLKSCARYWGVQSHATCTMCITFWSTAWRTHGLWVSA